MLHPTYSSERPVGSRLYSQLKRPYAYPVSFKVPFRSSRRPLIALGLRVPLDACSANLSDAVCNSAKASDDDMSAISSTVTRSHDVLRRVGGSSSSRTMYTAPMQSIATTATAMAF